MTHTFTNEALILKIPATNQYLVGRFKEIRLVMEPYTIIDYAQRIAKTKIIRTVLP